MNKKVETLDSLQNMINGVAIAIHTYDTFIPEIKNPETQLALQNIRSGHRRHLDLLTRRVEELGHRPRIQQNLQMRIAEWMMEARTQVGIAPEKMIRWALKGEDMGLTTAEEVVAGDLDEVSKELVDQILIDSAEYVNQLTDLIHE